MREFDIAKMFDHKNVLITGGLGFIGSTVARYLVQKSSARIVLVDSLIPDYGGNLFNINGIEERMHVNIADVRDENTMNNIVKKQDVIFNLAGTSSHVDSMKDPFTDLDINCRSQLSILEACRKHNPNVKIVFSGTRGEYGRADYLPVDEKHPLHPTDVNGINNMAGEWYHILYNNVYDIRATSLRLTNTYGPRHQMKHSKQGFLNWFIRLAMEDKEIPIYGDGAQKRDFNFVDDVAMALMIAAADDKANGRIYNLGTLEPVSVADIARMIIKELGQGRIKFVPFPEDKKRIEIWDFYSDYGKIKDELGWKPSTSLARGLKDTIRFYKNNKEHYW
ncbi:GDP-mannose 4,6-dehydratase [PVC group bacterium]|nr:GDP-mannose 4,6-dehydratase [PVC group bacterium]